MNLIYESVFAVLFTLVMIGTVCLSAAYEQQREEEDSRRRTREDNLDAALAKYLKETL